MTWQHFLWKSMTKSYLKVAKRFQDQAHSLESLKNRSEYWRKDFYKVYGKLGVASVTGLNFALCSVHPRLSSTEVFRICVLLKKKQRVEHPGLYQPLFQMRVFQMRVFIHLLICILNGMSLTFLSMCFRDEGWKWHLPPQPVWTSSIEFYSKLRINFSKNWQHKLTLLHGFQKKCSIYEDSKQKFRTMQNTHWCPFPATRFLLVWEEENFEMSGSTCVKNTHKYRSRPKFWILKCYLYY